MTQDYLIVSPCRDEADLMQQTIDSVVAQTVRPKQWVIVDDGSRDSTNLVAQRAADAHQWITVVHRPRRSTRVLGSGVVHAFNAGLQTVRLDDFDFVSKLDMDLVLPPTYFEALMVEMVRDERLGTASGRPHVLSAGHERTWIPERGAFEMSAGMAKFYRRETFVAIGGLVPEIMWDGIDCHEARRRGWKSRSFDSPLTDFKHLRPEGASDRGVLRGRRRHGYGQWFMGTDPIFMLASVALRVGDRPFLLGSLHMLLGYVGAAMRRVPRHGDANFRRDLRRFQRESLILGKRRATARWEERAIEKAVAS